MTASGRIKLVDLSFSLRPKVTIVHRDPEKGCDVKYRTLITSEMYLACGYADLHNFEAQVTYDEHRQIADNLYEIVADSFSIINDQPSDLPPWKKESGE